MTALESGTRQPIGIPDFHTGKHFHMDRAERPAAPPPHAKRLRCSESSSFDRIFEAATSRSSSAFSLCYLPLDVLRIIVSFIPLPFRLTVCSLVSRRWCNAVRESISVVRLCHVSCMPMLQTLSGLTGLTVEAQPLKGHLSVPQGLKALSIIAPVRLHMNRASISSRICVTHCYSPASSLLRFR